MSPIEPGEIRDILASANAVFRGMNVLKIPENLPIRSERFHQYSDITSFIHSLGGSPDTQNMNAISSTMELFDVLNDSEGSSRFEYFNVWLDSLDYSDSTIHSQLSFVLANERTLLKGLNRSDILCFVELVRARAVTCPVVLRRSFQKFGEAYLLDTEPGTNEVQVVHVPSSSVAGSMPAIKDIVEATAIVELRGIILKNPKRSTRLLPSNWSQRFRPFLGTYRQFVETRSPVLFEWTSDDKLGLISVTLAPSAADIILRHQRIVDTYGKSVQSESHDQPADDQYLALVRVSDQIERYKISGGKDIYDGAFGVIRKFVERCHHAFELSRVRKLLSDAAIVPLPLEWFSDLLVIPGNSIFLLKKSVDRVGTLEDGSLIKTVCSEILLNIQQGIPFVNCYDISSRIGLPSTELVSIITSSDLLLYAPDKGYSCECFEGLVYGYISPTSVLKYHQAVELLNMSPVRHLVLSVEKATANMPDHRLPTEYVIAWCSALDVEPRVVWRCLRDRIFWSGQQSEFQVVLRSKFGKSKAASSHTDQVPSDVIQSIKQEIMKLGDSCTIDKLSSNLHWGKQSELKKKYGPLKDVLQGLSDVFYDPKYFYLRSALDQLVMWPEEQPAFSPQASVDDMETKFITLASISSMIVYQLTSSGLGTFPITETYNLLANAGYEQDLVYSLDYLYVPDSIVYLRKSAINSETPTDKSVRSAVLRALRNSARFAIDYDTLIRTILGCGLYKVEEVDAIRGILERECGTLHAPDDGLGRFCFYNPSVVILKSAAKEQLATEFGDHAQVSVAMVRRKFHRASSAPGTVDIQTTDSSDNEIQSDQTPTVIPKWCFKGAVVSLEGILDRNFVIISVDDHRVSIRPQSNAEEHLSVPISHLRPKPVRAGDLVKVFEGPYKDSIFHVAGSTGTTVSLQITKFDFKSLPTNNVVCVTVDI